MYPPELEQRFTAVFDTGAELTRRNRDARIPAPAVLEAAAAHIRALETALDATVAFAGLPPRDTDLASMELQGRTISAARVRGEA